MKANNNGWTPERRKQQAEKIRQWQPWQHSTGAKTEEGKARSAQNARKHGEYSREAKAAWKQINEALRMLKESEQHARKEAGLSD